MNDVWWAFRVTLAQLPVIADTELAAPRLVLKFLH